MDNNHCTRWTAEENALLEDLWDPTAVAVVAEIFGRTEAAVRQRHYELSWGSAPTAPSVKPVVQGPAKTTIARRRNAVQERPVGTVCTGCR